MLRESHSGPSTNVDDTISYIILLWKSNMWHSNINLNHGGVFLLKEAHIQITYLYMTTRYVSLFYFYSWPPYTYTHTPTQNIISTKYIFQHL